MDQVDYVVVGAGSAGAIVARRLAESGAEVVLLEAGNADKTQLVRKPGLIAVFHNIPSLKKRLAWDFYTVPQKHALNRAVPQTKGRVLGGSSSINGMLFVRGNRQNYDDWADEGCKGWAFEDVLPSFKRLESWEDGGTDLRGEDGPIRVTRQRHLTPASQRFIQAMSDTIGIPVIDDYNAESQEGAAVFQRQRRHRATVEPQDVEDVITAAACPEWVITCRRFPGHLAVEDGVMHRELGHRSGDGRLMLR